MASVTRPADERLTRRKGFPALPDPDGDGEAFRRQVAEALKELYLRAENLDLRVARVEGKVGGVGR